jgi:hypothetical protein|tara:strand:- start:258 stop:431 length:174 start_codon:yes stop_codon:yes gene_type:complete
LEKIQNDDLSCFKFDEKVGISAMDIFTTAALMLKGGRFFLYRVEVHSNKIKVNYFYL